MRLGKEHPVFFESSNYHNGVVFFFCLPVCFEFETGSMNDVAVICFGLLFFRIVF